MVLINVILLAIFCKDHSVSNHKYFNQLHIWNKVKKSKNGELKIDYEYIWDPRIVEFKKCTNSNDQIEQFPMKIVTLKGHLEIFITRSLCDCHDRFSCLVRNKLFPATPINISKLILMILDSCFTLEVLEVNEKLQKSCSISDSSYLMFLTKMDLDKNVVKSLPRNFSVVSDLFR